VHFVNEAAAKVDPLTKTVSTGSCSVYGYGYLVVATGYQDDLTSLPGIGEDGHASTITTVPDAFSAANAWAKYLEDPGVIGATSTAATPQAVRAADLRESRSEELSLRLLL
jgi:hypothetical protein